MNNCEEIVEKYLLFENPIYTFSLPISILFGIIIFGVVKAYDLFKNSYINQLLIPLASIFIIMVLIDIISKNIIPYNKKNNLIRDCKKWKESKLQNIENFGTDSSVYRKEDNVDFDEDDDEEDEDDEDEEDDDNEKEDDDNEKEDKSNNFYDPNHVIDNNYAEKYKFNYEDISNTSLNPASIVFNEYKGECILPTTDCSFCSGGELPPKNIVTAIPGPQWMPQSAAAVQEKLKSGNYTPGKC